MVETNGHSHEDTNVGTTNLVFALLAWCWLNAHENVALFNTEEVRSPASQRLIKITNVWFGDKIWVGTVSLGYQMLT